MYYKHQGNRTGYTLSINRLVIAHSQCLKQWLVVALKYAALAGRLGHLDLCWHHTVMKLIPDGHTNMEILQIRSDRKNIWTHRTIRESIVRHRTHSSNFGRFQEIFGMPKKNARRSCRRDLIVCPSASETLSGLIYFPASVSLWYDYKRHEQNQKASESWVISISVWNAIF